MPLPPRVKARLHLRREKLGRAAVLPVREFIRVEEIAGWPLLISAIAAMVWANAWSEHYQGFWHTLVSLDAEVFRLSHSAKDWITDGLLPLLFFVAGMEIKRELLHGELSTFRKAAMPVATAVGGMALPALIYLAVNFGGREMSGWGVPVATDIAFVLMVLSLLGPRVPTQLKVFVLAFALVDDVGGVLVIAFFYSSHVEWPALAVAAAVLAAMLVLLRQGVRYGTVHVPLGLLFWFAMLESGVHTTIAGVVLGAIVPATPMIGRDEFERRARKFIDDFRGVRQGEQDVAPEGENDKETENSEECDDEESEDVEEKEEAMLGALGELVRGTESTVDRLLVLVNPWVSYLVLPLFALANSGIAISGELLGQAAGSRAGWGVFAGLLVGKPLGFLGAGLAASAMGWAERPRSISWPVLAGAAIATGIGFTVSLFIAQEAFGDGGGNGGQGQTLQIVKVAVLAASIVSAVAGYATLVAVLGKAKRQRSGD